MKRTVTQSEFIDSFRAMRPENFSRQGLMALYDHLSAWEGDTGEELELDVVGLCCDFSEYKTAIAAAQDYGFEPDPALTPDEQEQAAREFIRENSDLIEFPGGVILRNW